jgi:uncharacterized protein (TIGR00251 family)
MIDIRQVAGGVLIAVKAQPGAKRNAIIGQHADMLKIAVRQKPENGKANQAITALLAERLAVPKSYCCVQSGVASRDKRVFVANLSPQQVRERLGLPP